MARNNIADVVKELSSRLYSDKIKIINNRRHIKALEIKIKKLSKKKSNKYGDVCQCDAKLKEKKIFKKTTFTLILLMLLYFTRDIISILFAALKYYFGMP